LLRALLIFALLPGLPNPGQDDDDPVMDFAVFVTGADLGVLEPCGCSGGQLGGIGRRATLLEALVLPETPRLILSNGGLPGKDDALHRIRYEILLLCLSEMGYHAAALGPEELALGLDTLRDARELVDFPFLLSNVDFAEPDPPFVPFAVEEVAGKQILIFGILSKSVLEELPPEAQWIPPQETLEDLLETAPDADLRVVLLRGDRREAKALDDLIPDPKLILYSYSHSEPQIYDFGKRSGEIKFLSPGDRGRFVLWLKMHVDEEGDLAPFEPVQEPLELHYPESEIIRTYMSWYRERVITEEILAGMVEKLDAPDGAPYIAQESCILCHEEAYRVWAESTHAHAYETLVKAEREYDPECLSCHTVGFGYKTGFRSVEETPALLDVGCESCHGPCSDHVATAGRAPTPLTIDCTTCHNMEHSTEFLEEEYWPEIECLPDGEPDYVRKIKAKKAHDTKR
jgi:hypothetical protein